ncbi:uncharacterized protein DNG_05400 [Cephalotrichum gorgonifer]|uniref:GH16 domain-containing protein n=1 Tax=Cephalotrichum gorgonifer TaxID=2041049 RepID=A0AAE8N0M6_9PEZI|nr:uncharacterized protein DNG_05400 [Cephalotrichum gorgonifer]
MTVQGLKSAFVAVVAASAATGVKADCECGYSTKVGDYKHASVFTELLETDFSQMDDLTKSHDWVLPAFNVTKEQTHGTFGLTFLPENIIATAGKGLGLVRSETGKAERVGKTPPAPNVALELRVSSNIDEGRVSVAELDTQQSDLRYGSYRANMQLTDVAGTCAAFIWYFDDTQEIDMEFLSKDFNSKNGSYPVNLIVQSPNSSEADYDAAKSGNFIRTDLPFNPTKDFHEYRFDFVPGEVHFYADGKSLAKIRGGAVPTNAGHLTLQHWSNGNDVWSGGPPSKDAAITVRYVKAYYNSTDTTRRSEWNKRCTGSKSGDKSICAIPDIGTNASAQHFFFSNKNQTKSWNKPTDSKAAPDEESRHPSDKKEDEGGAAMWGVEMGLMVVWGMLAARLSTLKISSRQPASDTTNDTTRRHSPRDQLPIMSLVSGEKSNFQFILRLLNTNVDGKQKTMYALTRIKGVGRRYSNLVLKKADVDLSKRAGELTSEELERIVTILYKIPSWFLNRQKDIVDGKDSQTLANGVDSKLRDDLERLKKIRAHRGLRHYWGLRVRGQHTKTTGRRGRTVGVSKKRG